MASSQRPALAFPAPVDLYWKLGDDGGDVPYLSIKQGDELREKVFDAHGVDNVTGLSDTIPDGVQGGRQRVQLGFRTGRDDHTEYVTSEEALAKVEGIDDELAGHLIDHYHDIREMCKRVRADNLMSLKGDAQMDADEGESVEWVNEVDPEGLEGRMKTANVWIEPADRTADGY